MKKYIFPGNLRAAVQLWFWSIKDFIILVLLALMSVFILANTGSPLPAAVTLAYGFLSIRFGDMAILDFVRIAARYFIFTQQQYIWMEREIKK